MSVMASVVQKCVCIECGRRNAGALYRQYTGGSIQLLQCVSESVALV